jgi:hypothetical protein
VHFYYLHFAHLFPYGGMKSCGLMYTNSTIQLHGTEAAVIQAVYIHYWYHQYPSYKEDGRNFLHNKPICMLIACCNLLISFQMLQFINIISKWQASTGGTGVVGALRALGALGKEGVALGAPRALRALKII